MDGIVAARHDPPTMRLPRLIGAQTNTACRYLDRTVVDERMIGAFHEELSQAPSDLAPESLLLHTCERIEMYGPDPQLPSTSSPLLLASRRTDGAERAFARLTEIAAGVRSKLLAERFIFAQVLNARRRLGDGHRLSSFVDEALALALRLRRDHSFSASADYPTLAMRMVAAMAPTGSARGLVIVGSGMMARAVASHPSVPEEWPVLMVTRSPKRVRRRRRGDGRLPENAVTITSAATALARFDWAAVVATTNLVGSYRERVLDLLTSPRCQAAVDLSCVPVIERTMGETWESMYDERFRNLVTQQNAGCAHVADRIRADINAHVRGLA